ncbi:MAG: hypothetical protein ACLFTA_00435 [Candidatus Nanohaloarchaea archaeon]
MGYEKLAKGMTAKEARSKIQEVMPARIDKKQFQAYTESVFIGSHNYPEISSGVLSPSHPGDPTMLDNPGKWYDQGLDIQKIASLRTSLINSRSREDSMEKKEIAMARKPVNVEIELDRKPSNQGVAGRVKPVSSSADMKQMVLGENPSVNRKIEKAFYDQDLKAETALKELENDVGVYKLQDSFSAGLLGREEEREIVPTRWSITAVDDQLSKNKLEKVKQRQELGETRYFRNSYLGNDFHIFLMPGRWEYELLELKRPNSTWNASKRTFIAENYEPFTGRTSYADECAGAYYAARLGALEYLEKVQRQAKVLIVRDVTPEYWAPLGVWIIRETVRNAFNEYRVLEEKSVKEFLGEEFRLHYSSILQNSRMLSGKQKSLSDY